MRLLLVLLLLWAGAASAEERTRPLSGLVAEPLALPVTIGGEKLTLDGYVVRPDRPGRFPLIMIQHGTPGNARMAPDRSPVTYDRALVAFARRGYAAVVVMRRGFGSSGGAVAETLAPRCDFLAAARETGEDVVAALVSLRAEPWIQAEQVVLMGHSTGGLAVAAAAAKQPAGIAGLINFDGGRHGIDPTGKDCPDDRLVEVMTALGASVRTPALWLYAENDQSYGPDLVRRMLAGYQGGGAPARLTMLAPFGADGHDLVSNAPADRWLQPVEDFLGRLGLPYATTVTLAPLAELKAPASLVPACGQVFAGYAAWRWDAKAFAITPAGGCGSAPGRTLDEARAKALAACKANSRDGACLIYAVGQQLAGE